MKAKQKYQVTIRYQNGTERTVTGSYAYCARLRRAAFRMCHGMFDIKPLAAPSELAMEMNRPAFW